MVVWDTVYSALENQSAVNVSFDMHRILSIPLNVALSSGVSSTSSVIMDIVINAASS
jgi:hypothetical protein